MKLFQILTFVFILLATQVRAQNIVNGDLDGIIVGNGTLPISWQNISFPSPITLGTVPSTADLTSTVLPLPPGGIIGTPFAGSTFVSCAATVDTITPVIVSEGIQQTVTGFEAGYNYKVRFYQSVVKTLSNLDQSGGWSVFFDTNLINHTASSFSTKNFDDIDLDWELRIVFFDATSSSHQLSFVAHDDDPIGQPSNNINAALMMGIDSISVKINCDTNYFDIGPDLSICPGDTIFLDATVPNGTYLWQDSISTSLRTVANTGVYWVQVADVCGLRTDSVEVFAEVECEPFSLVLPNVFSPNADGINDVFEPIEIVGVKALNTQIFNRWGNLVFTTDNPKIGWDGKSSKGCELNPGVYFWNLSYIKENGISNKLNGHITLMR